MNLNKFNYKFEEQTDKWVEIGCPLMVLCVLLSLMIPSFFLKVNSICNLISNSNTFRIALSVISSQFVFIVPILFTAGFSSRNVSLREKFGLTKWNFYYIIEAIVWEVLLIVPLIILAAVVYMVCLHFGYNFTSPVIELLSKANKYGIGLVFIFAVIIAPVVEEIAFRRTLFVFMTRMLSPFTSAVITSLIFAFMHGGVVQVLPLFILSIVLQYLYLKHGTLFPSILLHCVHNFVIMVLFLIIKI